MRRPGLLCVVLLVARQAVGACEYGAPGVLRYEPRTFLGYACEDDCERHKAGFRWGERHGLAEPSPCAILGRAQAEGCRVYVAESHAVAAAGRRWAIENEVARTSDCEGAGERFRQGCVRALPRPCRRRAVPGCAETWPRRAGPFRSVRPGR